jgi:hypothetical protein
MRMARRRRCSIAVTSPPALPRWIFLTTGEFRRARSSFGYQQLFGIRIGWLLVLDREAIVRAIARRTRLFRASSSCFSITAGTVHFLLQCARSDRTRLRATPHITPRPTLPACRRIVRRIHAGAPARHFVPRGWTQTRHRCGLRERSSS